MVAEVPAPTSAPPPPPPPSGSGRNVGDVVAGRYRISGVVGKGAMGAVYAAEHTATGQQVALKFMLVGDDDSAEAHRRFYDEYNAVLDMPAEYYLDTIKTVFQDFALVHGTWKVKGQLVRPQDIKGVRLLTVEGELDDISGAGQTQAAHGLCSGIAASNKHHYDVQGAGHYGIFSGRRWREQVYPVVRDFIAGGKPKAVVKGAKAATKR